MNDKNKENDIKIDMDQIQIQIGLFITLRFLNSVLWIRFVRVKILNAYS